MLCRAVVAEEILSLAGWVWLPLGVVCEVQRVYGVRSLAGGDVATLRHPESEKTTVLSSSSPAFENFLVAVR